MYITKEELKSVAYSYQIDQIVEDDNSIIEMAILSAEEEIKSYLSNRYDIDSAFALTGNDRNALLVELTKDIALWQIVKLASVDMLYERAKERYDRAIAYLDKILNGHVSLNLQQAQDNHGNTIGSPIKFGNEISKQNLDW